MKRITLVCGHYGSGKTNFALNLAVNAAKRGEKITLVDLDIVNPYFRTADYKEELEAAGVNVIAQNLEGTTLDAPALTARMFSIFEESMGRVIVDVGGDDAGATALGRFSRQLNESGYDMLCVVNKFRKFISSPDEAVGAAWGDRGGVPSESDWVSQQLALGGADDCTGHSFVRPLCRENR